VLTLNETNKIARDRLPHVKQLKKRVLSIGTWFTKINLSDWVVNFDAVLGHALSIRFHVELLNVSRKFQQGLCVREGRSRIVTHERHVPNAQ
jgi:hypothetical protein